jgi:hypothetical protein
LCCSSALGFGIGNWGFNTGLSKYVICKDIAGLWRFQKKSKSKKEIRGQAVIVQGRGRGADFYAAGGACHRLSALLAVFVPRAGTDLLTCVAFGWLFLVLNDKKVAIP